LHGGFTLRVGGSKPYYRVSGPCSGSGVVVAVVLISIAIAGVFAGGGERPVLCSPHESGKRDLEAWIETLGGGGRGEVR